MSHSAPGWTRRLHLLLLAVLLPGLFLFAPTRSASADRQKQTVFHSSFGGLPLGPLAADSETVLELGTLYAETDTVAIVASPIGAGRALGISDAGTAELRFKAYPDGLPPVNGNDPHINGNDKYDLVVRAIATASISDTLGASFGIETDAGATFEFFSFGDAGQLFRDGAAISATYDISSPVKLEARIHLARNTADIAITTMAGTTRLVNLPVDPGISRETLNHLQYGVTGGAGLYTLDDVRVDIERESGLPAIIVITPPVFEWEFVDGLIFFMIKIKISNDGGRADGFYLWLDLGDLCELDDLTWLEGAGYVVEIVNGRVVIGIGQNNAILTGGSVDFKLKIKIKGDKVKIKMTFRYSDGTGDFEIPPILVDEPVPTDPTDPCACPPTTPTTPTLPTTPTTTLPRLTIADIHIHFKLRWERGGGLRIYGLPLTAPMEQENGVIIQYFERVRFEYHPEHEGTEYAVLLGLMGVELGHKQAPHAEPALAEDQAWYFAPTGHTINPAFRAFWRDRGGLYTFGYPIGPAFTDANGRTVQYFERTRLEVHPENAGTEYEILLGLLGEELLLKQQNAAR